MAFLGCVLVATWRPPGSRFEQLGLRRPRLSAGSYVAFVAGTGIPVAVGVELVTGLRILLKVPAPTVETAR